MTNKILYSKSYILNSKFYILYSLFLLLSLTINLPVISQINQSPFVNQQKPGKKSDNSQLAYQYYRNKEFEKAAELFEKLYNKTRSHNYYTFYLNCLIELGDYKRAEKLIKKQIKRNPKNSKYNIDLGLVYSMANKHELADKQFTKVINSLPPDQMKISQTANTFLYRNKFNLAIATYKKGRELLNNSYPFNLELAQIYYRTGNFLAMINEYLDFLEFDANPIKTVQNKLQTIISNEPESNIDETLKKSLLIRTQKFPEKRFYPEMLLWLSIQQKDFDFAFIQAKSIDRRFNENGKIVYGLAGLSASNKNYDIAIKAYNYIINKGRNNPLYLNCRIGLLHTEFLKTTEKFVYTEKEILNLEKKYIAAIDEFGENPRTIPLIRELAHLQAFYMNKLEEAANLLNETILMKNISKYQLAECKLELADILLFSGDVWEATLLYSQVEKSFKNEPIGHEAKFKNAKLFYYIGEFEWAKAQLDILKAATSKLIANDAMELSLLISDNTNMDSTTTELQLFAKADLFFYQNKDDLAIQVLDSINFIFGYHPLNDEVLFKKAQIQMKRGLFTEADSLLKQISEQYYFDILSDDAIFKRAELQEKYLNNPQKAMELYHDLLTNYPGSLFSVEARKRFRKLRGDKIDEM